MADSTGPLDGHPTARGAAGGLKAKPYRPGLLPLGKDTAPKAPLLLGGEDEDAAWRDVQGASGANMTSRTPTKTRRLLLGQR